MGRKSSNKKTRKANPQPILEKKQPVAVKNKPQPSLGGESLSFAYKFIFGLFFFALSTMLYFNTTGHRFVLDDHGIIANNKITKAEFSWENTKLMFQTPMRKGDVSDKENSLYRPFTKMVFNAEWNVFSGNPHHFHSMNVIFYGLLCVLIFFVLLDLFSLGEKNKKWVLPFLITLLFTVHPIHTEVVANIKSLDEILAMIGIVAAIRGIQLYLKTNNWIHILWAAIIYGIGLYSKESAVVGMAIFPLVVYFHTGKIDWQKIAITCVPLLLVALLFVWSRHTILSQFPQLTNTSIMDNLIFSVEDNIPMRFATAVMLVGFYVYTFFVPHPLACDYSYSTFEPVGMGHWGFLISFLLLVGIFIYSIKTLKNRNFITFGILWFFVTFSLASNVFFLIGTSFGERLFFTPSLGLAIVTVGLLAKFFNKEKGNSLLEKMKHSPVLWGIVLLVSVLFSFKTIDRNKDWKNDHTLFARDIKFNPNSTHLLYYMGNHLPSEDRKEVLTDILSNLGYSQQQINDSIAREVNLSVDFFRRSMSIYPYLPSDGYNQLGKAYFKQGKLDSALKYYTLAYAEDSASGIYTNNMGTVYYNRQQYAEALPYFQKAYDLDKTQPDFMNNIGCVWGATQNADSAIYWFDRASKVDSLDVTSLKFLETTYRAIGKIEMADYYQKKMIYVEQLRRAKLQ